MLSEARSIYQLHYKHIYGNVLTNLEHLSRHAICTHVFYTINKKPRIFGINFFYRPLGLKAFLVRSMIMGQTTNKQLYQLATHPSLDQPKNTNNDQPSIYRPTKLSDFFFNGSGCPPTHGRLGMYHHPKLRICKLQQARQEDYQTPSMAFIRELKGVFFLSDSTHINTIQNGKRQNLI